MSKELVKNRHKICRISSVIRLCFRLSEDKKLALAARDIESDIKEQFRAETLLRDEHEEM